MAQGKLRISFALVGALPLAACAEKGTLRLDGQVAQSTQALASGSVTQGLTLGGGSLVIDRARIAVSEIELEGGTEDDELEAEMGSAVVDLKLGGEPTTVTVGEVEAGTYHTLGLEFAVRDLGGEPASLLIEGTHDGAAFAFRSSWAPEAEFRLVPNVVVPANGEATAGVTFDVASWFTEPDGSVSNPGDPASRSRIESRIVDSISAAAEIETGEDGDG